MIVPQAMKGGWSLMEVNASSPPSQHGAQHSDRGPFPYTPEPSPPRLQTKHKGSKIVAAQWLNLTTIHDRPNLGPPRQRRKRPPDLQGLVPHIRPAPAVYILRLGAPARSLLLHAATRYDYVDTRTKAHAVLSMTFGIHGTIEPLACHMDAIEDEFLFVADGVYYRYSGRVPRSCAAASIIRNHYMLVLSVDAYQPLVLVVYPPNSKRALDDVSCSRWPILDSLGPHHSGADIVGPFVRILELHKSEVHDSFDIISASLPVSVQNTGDFTSEDIADTIVPVSPYAMFRTLTQTGESASTLPSPTLQLTRLETASRSPPALYPGSQYRVTWLYICTDFNLPPAHPAFRSILSHHKPTATSSLYINLMWIPRRKVCLQFKLFSIHFSYLASRLNNAPSILILYWLTSSLETLITDSNKCAAINYIWKIHATRRRNHFPPASTAKVRLGRILDGILELRVPNGGLCFAIEQQSSSDPAVDFVWLAGMRHLSISNLRARSRITDSGRGWALPCGWRSSTMRNLSAVQRVPTLPTPPTRTNNLEAPALWEADGGCEMQPQSEDQGDAWDEIAAIPSAEECCRWTTNVFAIYPSICPYTVQLIDVHVQMTHTSRRQVGMAWTGNECDVYLKCVDWVAVSRGILLSTASQTRMTRAFHENSSTVQLVFRILFNYNENLRSVLRCIFDVSEVIWRRSSIGPTV
ncbi:hypothetical protein DFH09DRAFT_1067797 [Mycena vulgaris]|nr:hypothetical protein DFH09DRAFT_1067797 [Mycena vulgaris]